MERAPVRAPLIKNLEFKVGLLLVLTLVLAAGFLLYAMYTRGAFERTQRLTLVTENAEGVQTGMTMTYAGFPIGRVKRLDLADNGEVRIEMAIPVKDAKWLRTTSVFTLEKSLVGGARIRAFTNSPNDPALEDGAERPLLTGDAAAEIPEIMAQVKAILANVNAMTEAGSSLNRSLAHVETVTGRMAGEHGVLGGMLGEPGNAAKVMQTVDRSNALLASLNDATVKADQRVFGPDGVMDEVQKSVTQINAILTDVRDSLKKADAILANGQAISADVRAATTDIAVLRAEVDDSLTKVNHLINEINRKWPFARDVEVKLP